MFAVKHVRSWEVLSKITSLYKRRSPFHKSIRRASNHSPCLYSRRLIGPYQKHIRLLKFNKPIGNGSRTEHPMSFELETELSENASYVALSYYWGDQKDPKLPISVNGITIHIFQNLYRALEHIAPKVEFPIWADAICLNQEDAEEKGQQIPRMRDIYRNSKDTIIWLGEGNESSNRVMPQLRVLGEDVFRAGLLSLTVKDIRQWSNVDPRRRQLQEHLERLMQKMVKGYGDKGPFAIRELIELSYRTWFRRVWVVQELSVARSIIFVCGDEWVPGEFFLAGFNFSQFWMSHVLRRLWEGGSLFTLPFKMAITWWKLGTPLMKAILDRRGFADENPFIMSHRAILTLETRGAVQSDARISLKMSLLEHLARAFVTTYEVPLEATNPKDRIYALLGISNDTERLRIYPEYEEEITYQQVYAKVARCLILQGQLHILTFCKRNYPVNDREESMLDLNSTIFGGSHENTFVIISPTEHPRASVGSLPSWTPDWSLRISPPVAGDFEWNLYHASGNRELLVPSAVVQPSDVTQINIEAVFVGKIEKKGTALTPKLKHKDYVDRYEAKTFLSEIEDFLRQSSKYSQREKEGAVWRIPIADRERDVNNGLKVQRATLASFKEYLFVKEHAAQSSTKLDGKRSFRAPTYLWTVQELEDVKPFLSDNGYVGLCPRLAEVGDRIYIPLGAHVPYILRKLDDGSHVLIGDAYVHGVMDGEIFEGKENVPSEILRLV